MTRGEWSRCLRQSERLTTRGCALVRNAAVDAVLVAVSEKNAVISFSVFRRRIELYWIGPHTSLSQNLSAATIPLSSLA